MNKKKTILLIAILLLPGIGLFIESESINNLLLVSLVILYIWINISDYLVRNKFEKEIKKKNMACIKVKENMIGNILVSVFSIVCWLITLKVTFFKGYEIKNNSSITGVIRYINSFDYYEKFYMFLYIIIFVIGVLTLVQTLFSSIIITDDKVIFYDNLVFEIDQIDEIKYEEPLIFKNKKIINLGKGFIDRKITIKIEDFDKVKSLLEDKNNL